MTRKITYITALDEHIIKCEIIKEKTYRLWLKNNYELAKIFKSNDVIIQISKSIPHFPSFGDALEFLENRVIEEIKNLEARLKRINNLEPDYVYPDNPYGIFGGSIIIEQPIATDRKDLFDVRFEWGGIDHDDFFVTTLEDLELLVGPKYAEELTRIITEVEPNEEYREDGWLVWEVERHFGPIYNNLEFGE